MKRGSKTRPTTRAARPTALLAIVGLVTSCVQPIEPFELPGGVDDHPWAVVALYSDDGRIVGSSGVFSTTSDAPTLVRRLPDEPEPTSLATFGYDALTGRPPTPTPTPPLARATSTDRRLPVSTTTWRRRIDREEWVSGAPEQPALTAPWLPDCPTLIPQGVDAFIDLRCTASRCTDRLRQNGCRLDLSPSTCPLPDSPEGTIDDLGAFPLSHPCTLEVGADPTILSFRCAECDVNAYLPSEAELFTVERLPIHDVPFMADRTHAGLSTGYLHGLAITANNLIVGSHGGEFEKPMEPCPGTPSTLHFLPNDGGPLREVFTATAAPCVRSLASLPGGFVGVFDAATGASLVLFDDVGQVLITQPIRAQPGWHPVDVEVLGNPPVIVVGVGSEDDDRSFVAAHSSVTLEELTFVELAYVAAIEPVADDLVAVGTTRAHWVRILRLPDLTEVSASRLTDSVADRGPTDLTFFTRTGHIVASSIGLRPAVQVLSQQGFDVRHIASSAAFEVPFSPGPAVAWLDTPYVLLPGFDFMADDAYVARFDPAGARFLPGVASIGRGRATDGLRDSQGRVWFVLGSSAEVVRVTSAPTP